MPLREARRVADEDAVRGYQQVMYAAVLLAGVWALFSGVPSVVGEILGRPVRYTAGVAGAGTDQVGGAGGEENGHGPWRLIWRPSPTS